MKRESKNLISGRKRIGRTILMTCIFLLLVNAFLFLLVWSYCSVEQCGRFQTDGIYRLGEWMMFLFETPFCSFASAWSFFLRDGWKPMLCIEGSLFLLFWTCTFRAGNFKNVEYGSAHWATKKERKPFQKQEEHDMPLAEGIYLTDRSQPANRNVLILAAPGGGKTFCVIIPGIEALTRPGSGQGSFLSTDTKGALYRDTSRMVRSRGIPTWLLNLSNPWYSDRYNPLENVHEDRKYTEISRLALAYAKNVRDEEANAGDAIWEDTFRALMVAVWCYQYDHRTNPLTGKPETRALWRTAELVRSLWIGEDGRLSEDGEFSRLIEVIRAHDPLHPSVSNYTFVAAGAAETVASVIFTAGSKINVFTYPEIEALTDGNDIQIDRLCETPCGVYLNFEVGSPYRAIAALFIEQLLSNAYYLAETKYGGKLPIPLKLFLDELPNLCKVYSLPERASTSRSYGIDFMISVQSMQQLERMFNKAEETLKNNCVTHIYLGTGEQKALEELSKALGKTTTNELSRSRNVGGKTGGGSDSDKALGRELALPDEIYSMPNRYAIVKQQHYPPILAQKFQTQKQPWYPELGGQGNPANSRTIEDAYAVDAILQKARCQISRRKRTMQMTGR